MPQLDLNELVTASGKLATLPSTVIELLDILSEPAASAAQVQKILERDPAMTANVLKIANSAFFGVRREISSVRDALVMLGNRRTATLAFVTGMVPILRRDFLGYGLTRGQFWDHALVTAAASARVVCRTGHNQWQCEAFTAGMIHDVGMLVLDAALAKMEPGLTGKEDQMTISTHERHWLGFDHCEAGGLLAKNWGFPDILIAPVSTHHLNQLEEARNGSDHWPIIQAVAAGNILAHVIIEQNGRLEDGVLPPRLAQLDLEALDLDPVLLENVLEELSLDLEGNLGEIGTAATALVPALN